MPLKDKEKNREYHQKYHKDWYEKNKTERRKQIIAHKEQSRLWVKNYKQGKGCSKCGESHPATLDFHHTNGTKEANVTTAYVRGWSIDRIKKEIDKCIILCSNCHRKHHYSD